MNEQTVYNLTRLQGKPGDIYDWSKSTNVETGIATITKTRYPIKRLVKLPHSMVRKLVRFNGHTKFDYELTDALFLVRKAELPSNFTPKPHDYVIRDGLRYNIMTVDAYSYTGAYVLHSRHLPGEGLGQVLDLRWKDVLLPVEEWEES